MPWPPIVPFLIPKPDVQSELKSAAKKAELLAGGMAAAALLNRRFPKTTPHLSNFIFGFEPHPSPSRMIKIKPGFVLTVAPEPIGATPPALTGLPEYTKDPLLLLSNAKLKAAVDKETQKFLSDSFTTTTELIEEAKPALQNRPDEFVRTARDKALAALQQLGPRPDVHKIGRVRPGDVDSRIFYALVAEAAQQELDRRANAVIDAANAEPLDLHVPLDVRKVRRFYLPYEDLGIGVPGELFADQFFANNPADP